MGDIGASAPKRHPLNLSVMLDLLEESRKSLHTKEEKVRGRGSPCPSLLVGTKPWDKCPLSLTPNQANLTHLMTMAIHVREKPKRIIMFCRKIHSTWSYVFLISSLATHKGFFLFLLLIEFTHLYATKTLSVINLFGTRALLRNWNGTGWWSKRRNALLRKNIHELRKKHAHRKGPNSSKCTQWVIQKERQGPLWQDGLVVYCTMTYFSY